MSQTYFCDECGTRLNAPVLDGGVAGLEAAELILEQYVQAYGEAQRACALIRQIRAHEAVVVSRA